jgi:predicted transposase/invertase (TIGR01784 family)
MKRRSDTRYTELFSHPFFVRRLLESFVDEAFAKELDYGGMEPVKTKFVTEAYAKRESDVIWKVRFRKRDLYLFILIEFQSSVDQRMPLRLFRYIAELYESLDRPAKGGRYPAVFPLVLYNGRAKWTAKRELAELIDTSIPVAYIPRFQYYVIEERSFSPATLIGMRNLAALLFLAETLEPEELALSIDSFLDIVKAEDTEAVGLFSRWLNDYLRQVAADMIPGEPIDLRIEEDRSMLAENFRIWRNKVYAEGRLEGRLEGEKDAYRKANQKTAYKLLAMGMSPEAVANFLEISLNELKALIEKG